MPTFLISSNELEHSAEWAQHFMIAFEILYSKFVKKKLINHHIAYI